MKRRPVFLAASIAELARYALVAFAAYDAGIAAGDLRGNIFRYASSAQLLCALGFFFLWVDQRRYCQFERLLAVGKAMCLVLLAAPALTLLISGGRILLPVDRPLIGPAAYIAIAAIDVFGLAVLFASRYSADRAGA